MKNQFIIAAALVAFAFTASAQIGLVSPSGTAHKPVTTNTTTALKVEGSSTSNLVAGQQYILRVPPTGSFGMFITQGSTNAATTTNTTFTFEGLVFANGLTNVVDNWTTTIITAPNGTTQADYVTNWFVGTDRIFTGLDAIRLRSIQNTNLASIWVTNLYQMIPTP